MGRSGDQACHIVPRRGDQARSIATARDDLFRAMVRQDRAGAQTCQAVQLWQVARQVLGFRDIGHAIFQRVTSQKNPALRQPKHGRIVGMDVIGQKFDRFAAQIQDQPVIENPVRQDQRADRRGPGIGSCLEGRAFTGHMPQRPGIGDDFAIGKSLGPSDVIDMPVRQDDGEHPHSPRRQQVADPPGAVWREMAVIDQCRIARAHGIGGEPQRQGPVVHPVWPGLVA